MHLVQLGRETLNLEYMIKADDRPDGSLLLQLESGQPIEYRGDDAAWLRRHLSEMAHSPGRDRNESEGLVPGRSIRPPPGDPAAADA